MSATARRIHLTLAELERLRPSIEAAWSRKTSADPQRWSPELPSYGQCAVTACFVQDLVGGEIVWAEARLPDGSTVSHYFNRIDGRELDLTRSQFPAGTVIPAGVDKRKEFASTRDYVLSHPATAERYRALLVRFGRQA